MLNETWMADGLCRQVDAGDIFFPPKGGSSRDAKFICSRCPVATPCLDWALETHQPHGIYGGKTERERLVLAKKVAA